MTDHLVDLLHDEADRLAVPPPAPHAVLAAGRRLRRRRSAAVASGAALALAVLGGGVALGTSGGSDRAVEPADAGGSTAAFAVGTTVYLDGGARSVEVADGAVKSLFATSAGTLVRHGDNPWSDGGGPQRFSLVTAGGLDRLDVVLEEVVPSADPDQPYLAWAEAPAGPSGPVEVVVHDVVRDEEAARVQVRTEAAWDGWGGWSAPPVALDGDTAYLGFTGLLVAVEWRTGEVREAPELGRGYPEVDGGRALVRSEAGLAVVDTGSGETLHEEPLTDIAADLSPDGRYLAVLPHLVADDGDGARLVEVGTGTSRDLPTSPGGGHGFTDEGAIFWLDGTTLVECSGRSDRCTETELDLAEAPAREEVRYGGFAYES